MNKLIEIIREIKPEDTNLKDYHNDYAQGYVDAMQDIVKKVKNLHIVSVPFNSLIDRLEKCFFADNKRIGQEFNREKAKKGWFNKHDELINYVEKYESELYER